MRVIKYIVLVFPAAFVIAFFSWRSKAPGYKGQGLHQVLDVADDFEVLMVGDMGSGDPNQMAVARAMDDYCKTHSLSAVIFLGDNFYPKGVSSINDPQWKTKFKDAYGQGCLGKLPFYAVLGNHDYKGRPEAQIAYHGTDPTWIMPHRFYDLKLGRLLQLTMIDTNVLDICGLSTHCTIDFMLASLKRAETPYKIVVGHHPIASSSGKYGHTFQGSVLESFLCGKNATYIAGHSHHLEHLKAQSCPMDLLVVGGGGADLYNVKEEQKETKFAQSSFGFLSLHVKPEGLTFAFYNPELKKLYEFEQKATGAAH